MTCCIQKIVPFVNKPSTTVPFTGNKPTVSVYYNIEGQWQVSATSVINYGTSSVTVDHGGLSTGIVKLIQ